MGFLRKIGRKIKKGVKKLFSSKIGSFIGSIGLSMMMGPVISKAFNGIKGVFTGATQAGTQAATTATTAATTGTTAGAGATATSEAVKTVAVEGAKDVAAKGVIDNTLTGAMEKVVTDNTLTNDLLLQAQEGLKGSVTEGMKAAKEGSKLIGDMSKKELAQLASEDLTVGQNIRKGFREIGLGTKEFTSDPFGKTKEYLGDSFVPDAVQSIAMSGIKSALTPEYEAPFQSKGVQNVGSDIQSSYMKEVQTQVPNMRATNFNQLNQSLFFGTLSPQYLAQQAQQMGLAARIPGM
jgi:hypothetical protein